MCCQCASISSGFFPTRYVSISLMHASTVLLRPSSVASPRPTIPASVCTLTNSQRGRTCSVSILVTNMVASTDQAGQARRSIGVGLAASFVVKMHAMAARGSLASVGRSHTVWLPAWSVASTMKNDQCAAAIDPSAFVALVRSPPRRPPSSVFRWHDTPRSQLQRSKLPFCKLQHNTPRNYQIQLPKLV